MENFLTYLGHFSQALQQHARVEELSAVERLLCEPLTPFADMSQKVSQLPAQNEVEESKETPG